MTLKTIATAIIFVLTVQIISKV